MSGLVAEIPNPFGVITDSLDVTGWAFSKVADGIAKWVLDAVEFFVNGAIDFLRTSSTPDVSSAWFSGAGSPYAAVRNVAAFLLVGFVFLGIIQGLLNGDMGGMIRRIGGGLPAAIGGMVVTTAVVGMLLALTDAMSNAVLAGTNDQALHFLSGFGVAVTSATTGLAAVVLGSLAVIAGLLLWIELIVRSSLVYILVAVSPLGFAATLWPSAKGILRKTAELLLAIILSKLVICIALAIGVAALSGAGTAGAPGAGFGSTAGASLGGLLVGTVLLGLAAFSPFIVLKLVPLAEAAIVAQGVSRSPMRATQQGVYTASSAQRLTRMAGGGQGSGGSGPGGKAGSSGSQGAQGATAANAAGSSTSGGATAGGGAAAVGGAAAGGRAASAGGSAAAGGAAGAVGGPVGAAAGAAGAAAVSGAAKGARKAADTAKSTAETASGGSSGSSADAPKGKG